MSSYSYVRRQRKLLRTQSYFNLGTNMQDSELNLPSDSSSQISSTTSSSIAGNPQTMRRASICRTKVVDDLLAIFTDSSIMNVTLKMDFVNEKAVDDAGVSKEVYTAFWEQVLEQCEGEMERVPRLRPDFSEAEWQAVGRIWVKGFLDHGVMPVKLSLAFILACISGIDNVDTETLMSLFLNYLPPIERSAVEKALQGTMEESDQEDLMDLFTRMGSHSLPPQNGMKSAIDTMAHKATLQEPKYIVDCFSTPMSHVKLKLPDKQWWAVRASKAFSAGLNVLKSVNVLFLRQHVQLFRGTIFSKTNANNVFALLIYFIVSSLKPIFHF
ncbi:uncharacterized protein [Nothobranchius furzeri]|uniref:uncharacterized protein isoform X2 n=1 Tax=Nothobranchius furzeri TaxID=105023 RepID=UPI0024046F48|nr:uncharacterized protein LOC107379939 isoform X2 [Nothobranchius furzeri]